MIVLRPDKQDCDGTTVLVQVAGRMAVPQVHLPANKAVGQVDRDDIVQKIKQGYRNDVIGVLPFTEENITRLGSAGVFAARGYPTHPLSKELQVSAQRIME